MTAEPMLCPNCNRPVPATSINIDRLMAVCPSCSHIFSFGDPILTDSDGEKPKRSAPLTARKLKPPKSMSVDLLPAGIEISRRWMNSSVLFLTFFVVFWDGFLVVWYAISLSSGMWFMAAFATLHLLVGLALTYYVLAVYLNKTRVRLEGGTLKVITSPVYYHPPRVFYTQDIERIYIRRGAGANTNFRMKNSRTSSTSGEYNVMASLYGTSDQMLIGNLDEYEEAAFFKQELINYLGLDDEPYAGDYLPTYG